MSVKTRNWVDAPSTNVIDLDGAKASRDRQALKAAKDLKRREQKVLKRFHKKRKRGLNVRRGGAWLQVRYQALKDAKGRCLCCGRSPKEGAVLHVDHIKPVSQFPELALTLSNLQVLCADCNEGKSNRDQTDWRP